MSTKANAVIGGVFVLVAACLTGGATLLAAQWNEDNPPPPSAGTDSNATLTSTPSPLSGPAPSTEDPAQPSQSAVSVWVADLEPVTDQGLWREGPAKLRDQVHVHTLNVATEWGDDADVSRMSFVLNGQYDSLTGLVGLPDGGKSSEAAYFEVLVDGAVVFEAQAEVGGLPSEVDLDVSGADDLELHVTDISTSNVAADASFADFALK